MQLGVIALCVVSLNFCDGVADSVCASRFPGHRHFLGPGSSISSYAAIHATCFDSFERLSRFYCVYVAAAQLDLR